MKKIAIFAAMLSAVALTGTAHAYQAEIGGSAGFIDPEHGSPSGSFGVNGQYYFNGQVQTRNAPLAEAAFLDRASNINGHYQYDEIGNSEEHTYGVGAEYFVPNSDFYLNGEIGRRDIEVHRGSNDTTLYSAEVGYLPAPGLLLAVGVKGYDNDATDGADPTVRAKYVTALSNGKDINLEASAAFGDLDEFKIAGDYFLDKTFSVGADYYSNDISDTSEFGVNARKFFTPQMSLEGRIGFGDLGNNDYNKFGVEAKYRF